MQNPKLRSDIEVMPVQADGKKLYAVTDTLGLIKNPIGISQDLLEIMVLLDGNRDLENIRSELVQTRKGASVGMEEVTNIIKELDSAMILENGTYFKAKALLVQNFVESPVRKAFLAGNAYPDKKPELEEYLGNILGPEKIPNSDLAGIVAPHIDLEAGREGYRSAYQQLWGLSPDTVLILGTGHRMRDGLFSLTRKDYETPLGLLKTDTMAVNALIEAGAGVISEDDFDHRNEHSIEFQSVFLKYVLKNREFRIVPVLCGDITPFLGRYPSFAQVPGVRSFCSALSEIVKTKNVLVVAGVDLSHIGPKFGDQLPASALCAKAREHDRSLMEAVAHKNSSGYWSLMEKSDDTYHVCGASSLATLLEIHPGFKGDVLHYSMCDEESTLSAVSFCAMGLRGSSQAENNTCRLR